MVRSCQSQSATRSGCGWTNRRAFPQLDLAAGMRMCCQVEWSWKCSREVTFNNLAGRPIPVLAKGEPIRELL